MNATTSPAADSNEKLSKRDEIALALAAQMEAGVAPWERPWSVEGRRPHNPLTGTEYKGANWLWLALAGGGAWGTFAQITKAGGTVKKGAKATPIMFWSPIPGGTKAKRGAADPDGEEDERRRFVMKTYMVFNLRTQTEGLDLATLCPEPARRDEVAKVEQADAILAAWAKELKGGLAFGGDVACFRPSTDAVSMPVQGAFNTDADFYATAMHELAHATGPRLGRKQSHDPKSYAFEELVAELAAAMLCAELGIDGKCQHAEYLAHWAKMLRDDRGAFMRAASAAQKAADKVLAVAGATVANDVPVLAEAA